MFDDEDMDEIKQIFVEESNEGLDVMESGLLELKPGSSDSETINNIFRAAHSIKGGGGTFGFTEIADFTHGIETLLDEVRDGSRSVTEDIIQLFLECVDCLRGMLNSINDGADYDNERITKLSARIQTFLDQKQDASNITNNASSNNEEKVIETITQVVTRYWDIYFKPYPGIIKGGNEPYRIFRELAKLGTLDVKSDITSIPDFGEINPENCYIAWNLSLISEVNEDEIYELFSWVSEECELEITEKAPEASLLTEESELTEEPEPEESHINNKTDSNKANSSALIEKSNNEQLSQEAVPATSEVKKKSKSTVDTGSVRVGIQKIDNLLDLVGELIITQSMLARFGKESNSDESLKDLRDGLELLGRNTRELQESAMQIRMLPIKVVFSRFPRLIRDLSSKLDKKIILNIQGETTEIDKLVMEKIGDPLVHLVRNSVDHGIEQVDVRRALGKPDAGTITLSAMQEAGNIVITIGDDGAGLNKQRILEKAIAKGIVQPNDNLTDENIHNLIFHPGFSTAETVSGLSGRGVGMDVVKRNISDLGGRVIIKSKEDVGSQIIVKLPLTLAIMEGQLVRVNDMIYVIPLLSILESVLIEVKDLSLIGYDLLVYHFRGEHIPIISLGEQDDFGERCKAKNLQRLKDKLLVICEIGGAKIGLLVDDLSDQQQVVIKNLETNFKKMPGLLGATILGSGKVALILDIGGLASVFMHGNSSKVTNQITT